MTHVCANEKCNHDLTELVVKSCGQAEWAPQYGPTALVRKPTMSAHKGDTVHVTCPKCGTRNVFECPTA